MRYENYQERCIAIGLTSDNFIKHKSKARIKYSLQLVGFQMGEFS